MFWFLFYLNYFGLSSKLQGPIHQRGLAIARTVLGDDMVHDFDMLISKVDCKMKKSQIICAELWAIFLLILYHRNLPEN